MTGDHQARASENWIARTHQRWKLATGLSVLIAAGVCMTFGSAAYASCDGPAYAYCAAADRGMFLDLLGATIGLLSLTWVCLSVRCAACGKRIVWWAMSTKPITAWLIAILTMKACPGCGDAGTEREDAASGTGA